MITVASVKLAEFPSCFTAIEVVLIERERLVFAAWCEGACVRV